MKLALESPAPHGLGLRLAAGRPAAFEAPVLRPIDLTSTHGVSIQLSHLEQMAASYDPARVEAATLNFDYAWGGPAHGLCSRLWLVGSVLWARFDRLSAEAVEALRSGQWPRRGATISTRHAATGGWYFTGLALLGAASPAVWGLGPGKLLSADRGAARVVLDRAPDRARPRAIDVDAVASARRFRRAYLDDRRLAELAARYPSLREHLPSRRLTRSR